MENEIRKNLINAAIDARKNAYAPYSNYMVGAALLCGDGSIVTGCNVENASYGAANCAERTAVFKAVSEGKRDFSAIAIAGGKRLDNTDFAFPCGICRQVLREFCRPGEFEVVVCKSETDFKETTLEKLLPDSFGPENLE